MKRALARPLPPPMPCPRAWRPYTLQRFSRPPGSEVVVDASHVVLRTDVKGLRVGDVVFAVRADHVLVVREAARFRICRIVETVRRRAGL